MLEKIALLSPIIAPVIKKFPKYYVYGAVSPDIIVGKKYAGFMHHCHNWRIGKLILEEAETEEQRSAAYGYLTHLAADVVAHNYYIPFKIIRSYSTKFLHHTYWEMRFDLSVPGKVWGQVSEVVKRDFSQFDILLDKILKKTFFSFKTNKRIFSSIVIAQKMKVMRQSLEMYAGKSQWALGDESIKHYRELTYDTVEDFLTNMGKAQCLDVNPAGIRKLSYAKDMRKRLKHFVKKRLITGVEAEALIAKIKDHLFENVYRADVDLPDVYDVM
ncbi:zinc dependent phospholipase C family protein [bacterium]|nr:zinc dependent phospholipase C family protein [bacterium]